MAQAQAVFNRTTPAFRRSDIVAIATESGLKFTTYLSGHEWVVNYNDGSRLIVSRHGRLDYRWEV